MKYTILIMLVILSGCCSNSGMTDRETEVLRKSARKLCELNGSKLLSLNAFKYSGVLEYNCANGSRGFLYVDSVVE